MTGPEQLRFAADEMLGSLAKWMRIMGYDTTYCKGRTDNEIASISLAEGRVLLTRDKELAGRAANATYIDSDEIDGQVRQVVSAFHLSFNENTTRCAICNGALIKVEKESVKDEAPPRSYQMTDEFFRCTVCGKLYWKGTHWKNMMDRMKDFGVQDRSLL
jgi:uncharacterized protein with PIN domain